MGNQVRQVPQNWIENNNNKSLVEPTLPQLENFNLNIVSPHILTNNFVVKPMMF